jgi:hypothetical protein
MPKRSGKNHKNSIIVPKLITDQSNLFPPFLTVFLIDGKSIAAKVKQRKSSAKEANTRYIGTIR